MEYRRSEDGGNTWSEAQPLPYSREVYESGKARAVQCEKAVRANNGDVILFNLEHDNIEGYNWTWKLQYVPTYLRSADGGRTCEYSGADDCMLPAGGAHLTFPAFQMIFNKALDERHPW